MSPPKKPEPLVPPETPAQREDPDFITALARGLAVLRCFRHGERALGNKDLATRTGLPRSTIARLTHTLTDLGYLEYVPNQEKYALGIRVLGFSEAFLSGLDLRDVARPQMQALANDVKATVALAASTGNEMMFIELAHGNPAFALRVSVGERVPRGTSALGRACVAGYSPAEREKHLEAFRSLTRGEHYAAAVKGFRQAFEDYDKYGVCFSLGDWNPDVHAVSTPMISNDGHKILAFAVSLPAQQGGTEYLIDDVAPKLKAMRDRVHRALGGVF